MTEFNPIMEEKIILVVDDSSITRDRKSVV